MGKKANHVKPTMANPMMGPPSKELTEKQLGDVVDELKSNLSCMFIKVMPTKEAVLKIIENDPDFKLEKNYKIRREKIKAKKNELKIIPSKKGLRSDICVGIRQCLKTLNKNESISILFYDNSLNFDSLKCIFDKGEFPIFGIPQLSNQIKKVIGLSCTCIALKDGSSDFPKCHELRKDFKPRSTGFELPKDIKTVEKKTDEKKEAVDDFGSDFIKL